MHRMANGDEVSGSELRSESEVRGDTRRDILSESFRCFEEQFVLQEFIEGKEQGNFTEEVGWGREIHDSLGKDCKE